jgi:hypothetical protein
MRTGVLSPFKIGILKLCCLLGLTTLFFSDLPVLAKPRQATLLACKQANSLHSSGQSFLSRVLRIKNVFSRKTGEELCRQTGGECHSCYADFHQEDGTWRGGGKTVVR